LSLALSLLQGVFSETPPSSATPATSPAKYSLRAPAHGASAPAARDKEESGTTSSGSTSKRVPSPAQAGQAP
jgi:hypothetical protein